MINEHFCRTCMRQRYSAILFRRWKNVKNSVPCKLLVQNFTKCKYSSRISLFYTKHQIQSISEFYFLQSTVHEVHVSDTSIIDLAQSLMKCPNKKIPPCRRQTNFLSTTILYLYFASSVQCPKIQTFHQAITEISYKSVIFD